IRTPISKSFTYTTLFRSLAQYAEETMGKIPTKIEDWYGAVAIYNGLNSEMLATDFADRVYTTIQEGVERTVSGQHVILDSKNVQDRKSTRLNSSHVSISY